MAARLSNLSARRERLGRLEPPTPLLGPRSVSFRLERTAGLAGAAPDAPVRYWRDPRRSAYLDRSSPTTARVCGLGRAGSVQSKWLLFDALPLVACLFPMASTYSTSCSMSSATPFSSPRQRIGISRSGSTMAAEQLLADQAVEPVRHASWAFYIPAIPSPGPYRPWRIRWAVGRSVRWRSSSASKQGVARGS